jgi:hypothetical protein
MKFQKHENLPSLLQASGPPLSPKQASMPPSSYPAHIMPGKQQLK